MNTHDLFLYLKYYSPFLADTSSYAVYGVSLSRSLARIAGSITARGWGWMSLASDVFCQVEFSASVWSLVQRSPTECGTCVCDREVSITRKPCPTTDCWAMEKNIALRKKFQKRIAYLEGNTRGSCEQGKRTFEFHKTRGISLLHAHLLDSQCGLCCMELVMQCASK
jgi:hypothetical protein